MKLNAKFLLFIFLNFAFIHFSEARQKPTLHLIVFADTADIRIGLSCKNDLETVREMFGQGSRDAGLELKEYIYRGDEFTKNTADFISQNISSNPENDVVVFYFSGHGHNEGGAWPVMQFGKFGEARAERTLPLRTVYNRLRSRGKLVITLADCCNKDQEIPETVALSRLNGRGGRAEKNITNIKNLLFSEGNIIASASIAEQFAWNSDRGGFFTGALFSAYLSEIAEEKPADWNSLLNRSKTETERIAASYNFTQNPQFEGIINGKLLSLPAEIAENERPPIVPSQNKEDENNELAAKLNRLINSLGNRSSDAESEVLTEDVFTENAKIEISVFGIVQFAKPAEFIRKLRTSSQTSHLNVKNFRKNAEGKITALTVIQEFK